MMSHTYSISSQPRTDGFALTTSDRWLVREDEDKYSVGDPDLLDLVDIINDRLTRAEALAWVLYSARNSPENAENLTAMIIAELIHEALETHQKQWDKFRHLTERPK